MAEGGYMLIVTGTIQAESAAEIERVKDALIRHAQRSREHAGCLDYAFTISLDDPAEVRVIAKWESEQTLQAHLEIPDEEFDRLIDNARVKRATVVAGEVGEEHELLTR